MEAGTGAKAVLTLSVVARGRWGSGRSHALWDICHMQWSPHLLIFIQKTHWTSSLRVSQPDQT